MRSTPSVAIILGLAVAAAYGAVDFLGGRASRHDATASVVTMVQATGMAVLVVLLVVDGQPVPGMRSLAFGAASGLVGVIGVGLLYQGLARGAMGAVASVTAVAAAVIPVSYGLVTGERPDALALVGVAAALVAVAMIASAASGGPSTPGPVPSDGAGFESAGRPVATTSRTGTHELVLATGAGVAFGTGLILLAESGDGGGFWPLLAARAVALPAVVAFALVTGTGLTVSRHSRWAVVAAGALDVAAVACYLVATRRGLISLVAVLGALSPVGTVVLARMVLGEHLVRRQLVGLALALAGVVLIAS